MNVALIVPISSQLKLCGKRNEDEIFIWSLTNLSQMHAVYWTHLDYSKYKGCLNIIEIQMNNETRKD